MSATVVDEWDTRAEDRALHVHGELLSRMLRQLEAVAVAS